MAELLDGTETAPNRVEFYRRKKWFVSTFETPREAYHFWLRLKRGVHALLYQDGKCVARGSGLESSWKEVDHAERTSKG
jgi:hypothetical protein